MNEGCATFTHYYILNTLYDQGLLPEGVLLEILHQHSNVVMQPEFDDKRYSGLNPYALGFNMMQDIKRICEDPGEEDMAWFPEIAGCGDWRAVLKDAWANYRDESFILQFLSPHLIRKMRLFALDDQEKEPHYTVAAIHDERGYDRVRRVLSRNYDVGVIDANIQIVDVDLRGDRQLRLQHLVRDGIPLAEKSRDQVLKHLRLLWGYEVSLEGIDAEDGKQVYETCTAKSEAAEKAA
jgi:spore cortex formation protein SpoVR/YcgB (stage V sporulation)